MTSTTTETTATATQLKHLLGDQAPLIIKTCDAALIAEHGENVLLRQALERIIADPVSFNTLLGMNWSRRAKKLMQILESNKTYWGYPDSLVPNKRAIRIAREVRDSNKLGQFGLY